MQFNGAALNVNKQCVTSQKTVFPKDNKNRKWVPWKIVVTKSHFYKFIIIRIIHYSQAKKEAEIKMLS